MEEDNNIPAGQLDASQLNAPNPEGTVSNVQADGMTLSELNTTLGKNYPTREAALKSIKDTFSYVGKKVDDVKKEVLAESQTADAISKLAQELAEEKRERFYDRNPQYANSDIRKFIEATGKNPVEVVNTPEFKTIFEKVSGYDENQKLKTVLESNPRLSSSRDSLSKARELQGSGSTEQVESMVASAVKDAYGFK